MKNCKSSRSAKWLSRAAKTTISVLLMTGILAPSVTMAAGIEDSDEVKDRFVLNYENVDINLDNVYDLPLYLTTGYYTEPSASGKITWESSNPEVAEVTTDGRVQALKEGTTTITATHEDYAGKKATCEVTVYDNEECKTFYYVSPSGSDTNPGTEEAPFQTIQKARNTIRELDILPEGGITVILEDGKYYEKETIEFTPEDSGTQEAPIVYKARNEGKAIITGEEAIKDWKVAGDVEGMAQSAKGNVYVADVEPGWRFHDLYVNGERQQVSRSVNSDSWRNWPKFYGRAPLSYDSEKGARVVFGDGELDGLEGNEDVEVILLPVMYWNSIPLVKYIDEENNTAYLQSQVPSNFWTDSFGAGEGYYNIINTLKYLDQPGEWCIDSKAGKVYYWPKDESTINTDEIVAPRPYELVRLQGDGVDEGFENLVEYVTFDGITFQYTDRLPENEFPEDWIIRNAENPDAAIYFDGTRYCRIINSEISHSGAYGITVNHYGQYNEILHNQMHDLGSGGVQLYGYGVGTVDVSHHNIVMYNAIYNMGVAPYQHAPGLGVFGSGTNTMAYNYIAGAPYAGIYIAGTDENSISKTKPDTRAAYDMFGKQSAQYGIRFEDLEKLPEEELDGNAANGEYFSIGRLAEKYQHSERNVAEYNILDDYSQSMDDGGALYSWYSGLANIYAYNVLKEELQGSRTWVFRLYMDDRALGFTLCNNHCTGNFDGTIDKSFTPYSNRWIDNNYAKYPEQPEGYAEQRQQILDTVEADVNGFKLPESKEPAILSPADGSDSAKIPTTIVLERCENASLYKVEIATDEAFENIVDTIETRSSVATTDKLDYETDYYCRVTTREYLGEPKTSKVVHFRTAKQAAPESPLSGVKLTNDIDAVLVQWDQVAKNYVNVYRRAEGETEYKLIAENVSGAGFLDSQVEPMNTYSYQVAPVNPAGEGPRSEELTVTTRELNVLFTDNFDNGTISDEWTTLDGTQVNLNPEDAVVEDGAWAPSGNWREYYVGVGRQDWDDYAVEADFTFNGLQPNAESYTGFGLITRANQSGGGKQFYQFIVRANDTKLELLRCDRNNWYTFKTLDTGKKPEVGDTYQMRFESSGKVLRMYLDGVLFAEFEDESYASGGIGFGYGQDYITIDNVRVCQPKEYKVNVEETAGGVITVDKTSAAAGEAVSVTVTPEEGYRMQEGSLTLNGKPLTSTLFTMPSEDVTLSCVFEKIPGLADKTALEETIAKAAQYQQADYTEASWAVFADALAKANEVNNNAEAAQEEVDAAVKALNDAIAALEKYVAPNKALLQKTYDYALTLSTEGVTDSAKKLFEDAVAAAKAVLDDEKATQEEVNTAWDNLLEGIWALGLTQGDKTMLEQLILKAEEMEANADKYVQDNWQQLVDALAKAKEVMADGDAMKEDVQPAAEALLNAILAQRFKADKSILESLVNKAEGMDLSGYTAESVAVFTAAFQNAKAVLADETLSEDDQAVVDEAVKDLSDAIENLSAETEDNNPDDGKGDTSKPDNSKDDETSGTNSGENESPATGDSGTVLLWAGMLLLIGVGLLITRRKLQNTIS